MPSSEQTLSPSIDTALVRRLIAGQFPQWADLPIRPIDPGGWDNRSFRLGNDMSVRLPSAAAYAAQVEKEQRWLPELAPQLPLPIPVPLARGTPAEGYPWSWSVYRWLDGKAAAAEPIGDLVNFARSLARFLAALQGVDASDGPLTGEHCFHRGGRLGVYDEQTRAALSSLEGRIETHLAEEIWADALASEWRNPPVWVHGDIAAGNLLVENGMLCAVIDFGCSAVGDPACDLAIAWTLFSGHSRDAFRAALPLDDDCWKRARGWALWKALIVAAGLDGNQREAAESWRVLKELIADRRLCRMSCGQVRSMGSRRGAS